ncbi:MAG: hypothetical protein E4H01_00720 [Lysobacterales bacterium]|nr:MAG: hypothetical protein E4H01_00720 [Xanthomonadales bacterium]
MDQLTKRSKDQCFTAALLTAAGAETVYDTTVTLGYTIGGQLYSKAAITDGAAPTTDINTGAAFLPLAADQASVFVWMINAAGTVAVAQGGVEEVDGDTDLRLVHPQFPYLPEGYVAFAYQMVQTTSAGGFQFGSDNWNATGVTDLIVDVNTLPVRPAAGVTA